MRATGAIERFLVPQRADEHVMNVLAASLGPVMEGDPVTGSIKRMPGDLVVLGTDGVFDRIETDFPRDVLRGCVQYSGDLQRTADQVIEELASFQDSLGYVCDDNLTLGLMGDGTAPHLDPDVTNADSTTRTGGAPPANAPNPAEQQKERVI